ncbi:type II toxin-antitoxin system VapC family toxin [Methylobacterium currus]|uniref:PIN domain-containing protein n=1 Tax=Methylobacterium currus TaxID=2051553 RepID=UPI001E393253|nr:type II toxin-antitoxin system VapC family toxin [Methylobacterium currus]UHC16184.1 type II toxin-antitoxin system VapC family toxin [Methylobacterium currus]
MIGIDTNVLLRYALDDDARQSPRAAALLESDDRLSEPAFDNLVVLLEFVWTILCQDGFEKDDVIAMLDKLLASRRIIFADRSAVSAAVETWRTGKAGFRDYLIGHLNQERGLRTTFTFDAAAAKHPTFSPMPA